MIMLNYMVKSGYDVDVMREVIKETDVYKLLCGHMS